MFCNQHGEHRFERTPLFQCRVDKFDIVGQLGKLVLKVRLRAAACSNNSVGLAKLAIDFPQAYPQWLISGEYAP